MENELKVVALQGLLEVAEEDDEDLLRKLRAFHRCLKDLPQEEIDRLAAWRLLQHSELLVFALGTLPKSLRRRIEQLQERVEEEVGE